MHSPPRPFEEPLRDALWLVAELCEELSVDHDDEWSLTDLNRIRSYCYESLHVIRHGANERLPFPDPAA